MVNVKGAFLSQKLTPPTCFLNTFHTTPIIHKIENMLLLIKEPHFQKKILERMKHLHKGFCLKKTLKDNISFINKNCFPN